MGAPNENVTYEKVEDTGKAMERIAPGVVADALGAEEVAHAPLPSANPPDVPNIGPYGIDPTTGQKRTEPEQTGTQAPDTPGQDENADGLKAGQATADNHGDILGV